MFNNAAANLAPVTVRVEGGVDYVAPTAWSDPDRLLGLASWLLMDTVTPQGFLDEVDSLALAAGGANPLTFIQGTTAVLKDNSYGVALTLDMAQFSVALQHNRHICRIKELLPYGFHMLLRRGVRSFESDLQELQRVPASLEYMLDQRIIQWRMLAPPTDRAFLSGDAQLRQYFKQLVKSLIEEFIELFKTPAAADPTAGLSDSTKRKEYQSFPSGYSLKNERHPYSHWVDLFFADKMLNCPAMVTEDFAFWALNPVCSGFLYYLDKISSAEDFMTKLKTGLVSSNILPMVSDTELAKPENLGIRQVLDCLKLSMIGLFRHIRLHGNQPSSFYSNDPSEECPGRAAFELARYCTLQLFRYIMPGCFRFRLLKEMRESADIKLLKGLKYTEVIARTHGPTGSRFPYWVYNSLSITYNLLETDPTMMISWVQNTK